MNTESIPQDGFDTFISGGPVTIKAMPMRADHAKREGVTNVPEKYFEVGNAAYCPGADGYLIEYFSGYRSWVPKSEFEATYKLYETKVDRMRIELADLNECMKEVTDVLYNPYGNNSEKDRWYLDKQLDAMREYANALSRRIEYAISEEREGQ